MNDPMVVPESIGVFLLTDNRLLREALARILNKKNDMRVVAAAGFSTQIVEQIISAGPDVLLTDSTISALSELQLVQELHKAVPGLKVIAIGMELDDQVFLRAVRDGIVGYVLREASAHEVAGAVRAVVSGQAVCPPSLCLTLFQHVSRQDSPLSRAEAGRQFGLSRREQQLVQMIGRSLTNKEIAAELNLSEQTVKNHVHRILQKLGAQDRIAVIELCRQFGVVA